MSEKLQWICEACDSPNTVGAGESAICRFCRLTYDVKIELAGASDRDEQSPAIEAAEELLSFEPEPDDKPPS
jgi:hypothetical protein